MTRIVKAGSYDTGGASALIEVTAEEPILRRHRDELKKSHGVFAVQTTSDQAAKVAEIAARHGARVVVHFGCAVVMWLQLSIGEAHDET